MSFLGGTPTPKSICQMKHYPGSDLLALFLLSYLQISSVLGHGRLVDPPSRATAWRYGFATPADYNDHQGYCGGATYQHVMAGGRCGICGDPWGAKVKHHEAPGGKYAKGVITGTYKAGSVVPVTVQITANHMGYFVFKMCPNNDPSRDPQQSCFNKIVLRSTSNEVEHYISHNTGFHTVDLVLPQGLTCKQCILQWTYHTANSWGEDPDGRVCVGCGPQETFRACADIRIVQSDQQFWNFVTTDPDFEGTTPSKDGKRIEKPAEKAVSAVNKFISSNEIVSSQGQRIKVAQKNNRRKKKKKNKARKKNKKKSFRPSKKNLVDDSRAKKKKKRKNSSGSVEARMTAMDRARERIRAQMKQKAVP